MFKVTYSSASSNVHNDWHIHTQMQTHLCTQEVCQMMKFEIEYIQIIYRDILLCCSLIHWSFHSDKNHLTSSLWKIKCHCHSLVNQFIVVAAAFLFVVSTTYLKNSWTQNLNHKLSLLLQLHVVGTFKLGHVYFGNCRWI